jgi:signal-transduction protein with cAMP-binding, CBS, and nucleotidyltransferase domain
MLNRAGYRYCEGLIMASNHQWCLSLDEWNRNFERWIADATAESILELNVFFDIRATYGEGALVDAMHDNIQHQLKRQPSFFTTYAHNCLQHEIPLTATKQIKVENHQGQLTLNLKQCLRPMEIFCRLYALKHDIRESNTVTRLKLLAAKQELDAPTLRDMLYIFDHIWQLRFMNQIDEYTDLCKVNDDIDLAKLSTLERQHLESVLERVSLFHDKVERDFLR